MPREAILTVNREQVGRKKRRHRDLVRGEKGKKKKRNLIHYF
jgi:hypothetical protein